MRRGLLVVVALSCAPALTPRPQDSSAPRDFYAQFSREKPACDREVAVLPAGSSTGRTYKEVASISATCSPGSIELCEERLKSRACELGADAVIETEPAPGATPSGASGQSLVSRGARAIRWTN
jgi:hypothetical protein